MKYMNKFCFEGIYNGRLWEKYLRVSAQYEMYIYRNFLKKKGSHFWSENFKKFVSGF